MGRQRQNSSATARRTSSVRTAVGVAIVRFEHRGDTRRHERCVVVARARRCRRWCQRHRRRAPSPVATAAASMAAPRAVPAVEPTVSTLARARYDRGRIFASQPKLKGLKVSPKRCCERAAVKRVAGVTCAPAAPLIAKRIDAIHRAPRARLPLAARPRRVARVGRDRVPGHPEQERPCVLPELLQRAADKVKRSAWWRRLCTENVVKGYDECAAGGTAPCKVPTRRRAYLRPRAALSHSRYPAGRPDAAAGGRRQGLRLGLDNDFKYEACDPFCSTQKSCMKCKCRTCAYCTPPSPPRTRIRRQRRRRRCSTRWARVQVRWSSRGRAASAARSCRTSGRWEEGAHRLRAAEGGHHALGVWRGKVDADAAACTYVVVLGSRSGENKGFGFNAGGDFETEGPPTPIITCLSQPPPPPPPPPPRHRRRRRRRPRRCRRRRRRHRRSRSTRRRR